MDKKIAVKKKIKIIIVIIFISIIVSIIMGLSKIYGNIDINLNSMLVEDEEVLTIEESEEENKTISEMLEETMPTVVGISKIRDNGLTAFNLDNTSELGLGSGVIISEKGYILTNEHVSGSKYSTCYITLENGKNITGTVVWADQQLDLSVVKVNQQFSYSAKLGNSENIKIGERVYAIGNPIGMEFQRSVTSGIISAKDRTITFEENNEKVYMDNLIQTDATINPGNSGGPLLNIYGEIVGINSVKIASAEGMGFAVPINIIKPILDKLEKEGKFEEASIGILAYDSNVSNYLNYGIAMETGIYVLDNKNNSQIKIGDNIIQIDDVEIKNLTDLREYIYSKKPGDEVKITLLRNNKKIEVKVILSKKW